MKLGVAVVCALGLSLACGPRAGAEEPGGAYTIEINGDGGLIVPTGGAEVCQDGVCVSTDVTTDSNGVVSGSGSVEVDGGTTATVDLGLAGRVSGTTSKPKLVLVFVAEGTSGGANLQGKGKLKCQLGTAPDVLECTGKAKLCAFELGKKLGCEKLPFATQVAFMRQPFALDLDLETILKGTVTGDANARIGAITIASYAVKGKYKSSADTATLVLKSADKTLKTKVALKKVVLSAGGPTAGTAVFKLMGQKGAVELPSIAPALVACPPPTEGWMCSPGTDPQQWALFLQGMGVTTDPRIIPAFDPYSATTRSR